ncbi:metal-dependent hydrolase family protein [Natronincola ferrireducens]|uniref:Imidazolonepropionase n=1 Tax=Natronincola ferrireducens TaxID=393762 RepID=A0A1G9FXB3_9FIRM|nr:amidohydrolase family protein [Natronincola ferrireducens]SDK93007.1 Imidazolonepropionase [Natronincola ferrireducens]
MKKILFKGATLIDGNGGNPIENTAMLVEDKIIKQIGTIEEVQVSQDVEVIELNGRVIMPGLINAHVHIMMEPVGDPFALMTTESETKSILRAVKNLQKHLRSGVTYFRDLGGINYIDLELKKAVDEGFIEGPSFLAAGKMITMTGGHGWQIGRECDGVPEVIKATREQLKAGVDVIKIMATGGVMTAGVEPGSPQLSLEEIRAAVEEANKAGRRTATHAQGTTGIKNAILAGINSVEHGIFLDDETIQLMVEKNVYLVPTLAAPHCIVEAGVEKGVPLQAVEKSKKIITTHFESFNKARKAGVKIAMGTDAGTPFNLHDNSALELKLMMDAGMTAMEAIIASTKTAAELLGIDATHGTLETGKTADFIVLPENPLENIEALYNIETVYKNGKAIKVK